MLSERMFRKNPCLRQSDSPGMNKVLLLNCLPMSVRPVSRLLLLACAFALGLSGCVDIPELDEEISKQLRDADYPMLLPIDSALAIGTTKVSSPEDVNSELAARVARLEQKAEALRQPILDAESHSRLRETVGE